MTKRELVAPDPELCDDVVCLRPWAASDAPAVAAACADAEIARWTTVPSPYTVADARQFIERTMQWWSEGLAGSFAVLDPPGTTLLGSIDAKLVTDVSVEIGYWVAPQARRRGVGSRSLDLVAQWCFAELGMQVATLQVLVGNDASVGVAERAGFTRVGKVETDTDGTHREALLFARSAPSGS